MVIGTVAEGPTDRMMLEAVLNRLIPGQHIFLPLQPQETFGELGTGWKGIRKWCSQTARAFGGNLEAFMSSDYVDPIDLLVIHIDADVVREPDLQNELDPPEIFPESVCPPASIGASVLIRIITRWLEHSTPLPPHVLFAIPGQDTENWVFSALYPDNELVARNDFECTHKGLDHPGYLLTLAEYGKHLRRKDGAIKKSRSTYRGLALRTAQQWQVVCAKCVQAETFDRDVKSALAGIE